MKVSSTPITKMVIEEVPRLDPVHVFLEDVGPRQGRVTINCYGRSWTAYWGGMGDRTVAEFFLSADEHYLAGNLSGIPASVFDPVGLTQQGRREVIERRRERDLAAGEARDLYDRLSGDWVEHPETESQLMQQVFGDDWWHRLPEKPNPDYQYLCRIINAVKAAIRHVQEPEMEMDFEPSPSM